MTTKAIAYLRTSSATNVGGDSDKRQRDAIQRYARANGVELVDEYYDAAVSGADAVQDRPGFSKMLDRIEGNGVRLILVEDQSRFARDLLVQEAGLAMLVSRGVQVLTANGDDMTATDDPMRKMLRQIVGAVMEAEKARLVAKLKAARDRRSQELGYTVNSRHHKNGTVAALRELREEHPDWTQDELAEGLEQRGFRNSAGKRLAQVQVSRLLRQMEQNAAGSD
jgi:DNA invertase Pin-like site-specific DNA recombinase